MSVGDVGPPLTLIEAEAAFFLEKTKCDEEPEPHVGRFQELSSSSCSQSAAPPEPLCVWFHFRLFLLLLIQFYSFTVNFNDTFYLLSR